MMKMGGLFFVMVGLFMFSFWVYDNVQARSMRGKAELLPAKVLSLEERWSKNKTSRWGLIQVLYTASGGDTLSWSGQCSYDRNCGQIPCPAQVGDTVWLFQYEEKIWPRDVQTCVRTDYVGLILGLGFVFLGSVLRWMGGLGE